MFDASSLVGAPLKEDSVPERALLFARSRDVIRFSKAVEDEVREAFARPKFRKHLASGRAGRILELIGAAAPLVQPTVVVTDRRDAKDNTHLELALAAGAGAIVSSGDDLLVLHPWRGIEVLTPAEYASRSEPARGALGGDPR